MKTYETGHGTFYAYIQDVKIEFESWQDYILPIIDKIISKIKQTKCANSVSYSDDRKIVIFSYDDHDYFFEIKKRCNGKLKHLLYLYAAS